MIEGQGQRDEQRGHEGRNGRGIGREKRGGRVRKGGRE